jgi:hypothetical protein
MNCPCGEALHYTSLAHQFAVERLVAVHGPDVTITTPEGSWRVPRHYIALHGVKAVDLPALAVQYGWVKVE